MKLLPISAQTKPHIEQNVPQQESKPSSLWTSINYTASIANSLFSGTRHTLGAIAQNSSWATRLSISAIAVLATQVASASSTTTNASNTSLITPTSKEDLDSNLGCKCECPDSDNTPYYIVSVAAGVGIVGFLTTSSILGRLIYKTLQPSPAFEEDKSNKKDRMNKISNDSHLIEVELQKITTAPDFTIDQKSDGTRETSTFKLYERVEVMKSENV